MSACQELAVERILSLTVAEALPTAQHTAAISAAGIALWVLADIAIPHRAIVFKHCKYLKQGVPTSTPLQTAYVTKTPSDGNIPSQRGDGVMQQGTPPS
jgi:hypothetical protein